MKSKMTKAQILTLIEDREQAAWNMAQIMKDALPSVQSRVVLSLLSQAQGRGAVMERPVETLMGLILGTALTFVICLVVF